MHAGCVRDDLLHLFNRRRSVQLLRPVRVVAGPVPFRRMRLSHCLPPYSWLASNPVDDFSLHVPLDGLIISPPGLCRQEVSAAQQGDLKVAKAGLQGAAGPLSEREVSSLSLHSSSPKAAKEDF